MKNRIVINQNTGLAFGPFTENEAGEFFTIWSNIIPGLIVLPLHYKPITRENCEFVAGMMSNDPANN